MNPPRNKRKSMKLRRSRSGRFTRRSITRVNPPRAHRRRTRRIRRITRRNPPAMTPTMRAKISRAVKAANARRRAGGGAIARIRGAISRRRPTVITARRSSRRAGRSGGSLTKGVLGSILSPTTLGLASGAVTASIGTGFVLRTFGDKLPGSASTYGRVAYQLLIPATAAFFLRRKYRNFAEGLVVGGLVMASAELIRFMRAGTGAGAPPVLPQRAGLGEYYDATRGLSGMGLSGELGAPRGFRAYPDNVEEVNGESTGGFPDGAW